MNITKVGTVIVGGGCQAVALACRLLNDDIDDFVIVDPQPLMQEWFRNIEAQGIQKLRTPYTAHLAPNDDPEAMVRGTRARGVDVSTPAATDIFNRHSKELIKSMSLERHRVPGQVKLISPVFGDAKSHEFIVDVTSGGQMKYYICTNVIVAVGLGKPWMPDMCMAHPKIVHSHYVDVRKLSYYGDKVCIVGSGLTAATLATAFVDDGATVNLCCRRDLSVNQLETNPEWRPGQRLHKHFLDTMDSKERARQLRAARATNVVTPDVWERLTEQIDNGHVNIRTGVDIDGIEMTPKGKVQVAEDDVDLVVFATGYKLNAPSMPLIKPFNEHLEFVDGLPVLSDNFESDVKGLYFMGKLGELAGGPLMRNIPGAQYASRLIAEQIA